MSASGAPGAGEGMSQPRRGSGRLGTGEDVEQSHQGSGRPGAGEEVEQSHQGSGRPGAGEDVEQSHQGSGRPGAGEDVERSRQGSSWPGAGEDVERVRRCSGSPGAGKGADRPRRDSGQPGASADVDRPRQGHARIPGGIELAYAVTGRGPPLVLLHGGEADHTQYDAFVPHLAPRLTCIAYSQRDCGATRNPDAEFGILELADDAAALIAALGFARAHVFGSSLGSVIAQALAVRHPDCVDRLVLSAAIRIGESIGSINPEAAAELGALRADPAANAPRIARYFYPEAHLAAHPALAQRFAGGRRGPAQQARRNALIPGAPRLALGGIAAPTLLLVHAEDRLVPPAHSLGIAREIPGAATVVLEGLGHVGTIQAPERVAAAVLEFLAP